MFLENLENSDYYKSSNILCSTYDEPNQILYITFASGGIYSYDDLPKNIYEEFRDCESQGKYFLVNIKDKHKATLNKSLLKEQVLAIKTFIKNYK